MALITAFSLSRSAVTCASPARRRSSLSLRISVDESSRERSRVSRHWSFSTYERWMRSTRSAHWAGSGAGALLGDAGLADLPPQKGVDHHGMTPQRSQSVVRVIVWLWRSQRPAAKGESSP